MSDQFGFFTPFTLYLVNGDWVLDPQQPAPAVIAAEPPHRHCVVSRPGDRAIRNRGSTRPVR